MRRDPPGSQNSNSSRSSSGAKAQNAVPQDSGVGGQGTQPGMELPSPQDPGPTCQRSQHRPCPSEKDTAGTRQPSPSNSPRHSPPWKVQGRSWLPTRSGTNISVPADGNVSSNMRLRMKANPAGPQDRLFGSGGESLMWCFINHNG